MLNQSSNKNVKKPKKEKINQFSNKKNEILTLKKFKKKEEILKNIKKVNNLKKSKINKKKNG